MLLEEEGPGEGGCRLGSLGRSPALLLAAGVTLGETWSALLDTQCSALNPAQRTIQNPFFGLQRPAWSVLPRPGWPHSW